MPPAHVIEFPQASRDLQQGAAVQADFQRDLPLIAAALAAPAWAGATGPRVELLLHGMDCAICVQGLEQRLRNLPGAEQVRLDVERGRLNLLFRPGSTVADQTLRNLMRDAGFAVRQIRRSPVAP